MMAKAGAGLALAVAVALATGCGKTKHVGADKLARVAKSVPYPVFAAGTSFGGVPLTQAEADEDGSLIAYGPCERVDDEGCVQPILVDSSPFRVAAWQRIVDCRRMRPVRGTFTLRHVGLVLLTGRMVIEVFARNPHEERRLAETIQPVGRPRVKRLPPPASNVRALFEARCR